jgi:hypothetical protein
VTGTPVSTYAMAIDWQLLAPQFSIRMLWMRGPVE